MSERGKTFHGMKKTSSEFTTITLACYTPTELLETLRAQLSSCEVSSRLLTVRGLYRLVPEAKMYSYGYYDRLVDTTTGDTMSVVIPERLRQLLTDGQVVTLCGTVFCSVQGEDLRLSVRATRLLNAETGNEEADDEWRRACLQRKDDNGRKDVDALILAKLRHSRVCVALIIPETAKTIDDFREAVRGYELYYDFIEHPVNFSDTEALCTVLRSVDKGGYDVICIMRGGGSGIEMLDRQQVAETLADLDTAFVYGAGHESDRLFIRELADKDVPTPKGLGTYFRDIARSVEQNKRQAEQTAKLEAATKRLEETEAEIRRERRHTVALAVVVAVLVVFVAAALLFYLFDKT